MCSGKNLTLEEKVAILIQHRRCDFQPPAGADWKRRRRLWMPFFNTDKLETYSHVMCGKSHLELKKLETWADTNVVFDLSEFMSGLTINIVSGEYGTRRHLLPHTLSHKNHVFQHRRTYRFENLVSRSFTRNDFIILHVYKRKKTRTVRIR